MNYIVAVSGGVDSVVLLDMLVKNRQQADRLIVAHFDHGIRPESDADERFVKALSAQYACLYMSKREELGKNASEATARERRYKFLYELASQFDAKIITAHHQDDVIETITINFLRGTGWRGLAVMDNDKVLRPLLTKTKREIYEYALTYKLEWVEDETNSTEKYLRNRVRRGLGAISSTIKDDLARLRKEQLFNKQLIEIELRRFSATASRYFFVMIPRNVAVEVLRIQTNSLLTMPQLDALLHAIKTARPNAKFEAGNGITVRFRTRDFIVENSGRLV